MFQVHFFYRPFSKIGSCTTCQKPSKPQSPVVDFPTLTMMGLHVRAPRKPDELEHKPSYLEMVLPTQQPEEVEEVTVEPSFDVSEEMKPFRLSFHSWTPPDPNSKAAGPPNRSTHEVFATYRLHKTKESECAPGCWRFIIHSTEITPNLHQLLEELRIFLDFP